MKNKPLFAISGFIIAIVAAWFVLRPAASKDADLIVPVKKGEFEVVVTASGELEAKNSVRITGPSSLQAVQIWQVKISDLVAEGTTVKKGDYIALLDRTEIGNKMKDRETELQKIESQFVQTQLDTTLTLRAARDELTNLAFAVKEKEIVLEQSKFEPPATIRQAEIDVEKAKRSLQQAKENYRIKKNQAVAKMQEVGANLSQNQTKLKQIQDIAKEFTITAPEAGMVIYQREWNGRKKTVGSNIEPWDPTVATLPDLSVMISKTYVNEVDIRKIKKDQIVRIGLDAFPEKKMTGKVVSVANVGEQRPNSEAKVFEVSIQVNESDTTLRPAMTTSNNIVANQLKDVLYVPLEALHAQGDSLTFVYKKEGAGLIKQQVKIGQTNDNEAVIMEGLQESDQVYLSVPKNAEDKKLIVLQTGDKPSEKNTNLTSTQ
ncbi:HlyD family efflux transporter periplasmic adaptor subunit [Rhodocytophaga rosea]|uniref:HlyD family efflux transporter periplasmic adaptor subunit n=1 Tax=Rhodocytophaga rosea TaxID=2704465 RepID=A0A6C0GRQ4_9BACT|nr:efflux RND transporter periplasmic adaptor subunit [Rhodocytophaga rosea]QHT70283.1 HlyD family efflux transporter periplasmic adaptor subunit [Rhodocytophaga rosea]